LVDSIFKLKISFYVVLHYTADNKVITPLLHNSDLFSPQNCDNTILKCAEFFGHLCGMIYYNLCAAHHRRLLGDWQSQSLDDVSKIRSNKM